MYSLNIDWKVEISMEEWAKKTFLCMEKSTLATLQMEDLYPCLVKGVMLYGLSDMSPYLSANLM